MSTVPTEGFSMPSSSAPAPAGAPTIHELQRQLRDIGEGLHAQLDALSAALTPDRCERVACNLDGARRFVLQLCERLASEGGGNVRG